MNLHRALLLLGVGIVLAAGLLWTAPSREPPRLQGPRHVQQIHIQRPRGGLDLERRGGRWRLSTGAADPRRVERLLQLARAVVRRDLGRPPDLRELGLDPPRARIRFDHWEIAVGRDEPIHHRRYLLTPDGRVLLVDDRFSDLLYLPAASWLAAP